MPAPWDENDEAPPGSPYAGGDHVGATDSPFLQQYSDLMIETLSERLDTAERASIEKRHYSAAEKEEMERRLHGLKIAIRLHGGQP